MDAHTAVCAAGWWWELPPIHACGLSGGQAACCAGGVPPGALAAHPGRHPVLTQELPGAVGALLTPTLGRHEEARGGLPLPARHRDRLGHQLCPPMGGHRRPPDVPPAAWRPGTTRQEAATAWPLGNRSSRWSAERRTRLRSGPGRGEGCTRERGMGLVRLGGVDAGTPPDDGATRHHTSSGPGGSRPRGSGRPAEARTTTPARLDVGRALLAALGPVVLAGEYCWTGARRAVRWRLQGVRRRRRARARAAAGEPEAGGARPHAAVGRSAGPRCCVFRRAAVAGVHAQGGAEDKGTPLRPAVGPPIPGAATGVARRPAPWRVGAMAVRHGAGASGPVPVETISPSWLHDTESMVRACRAMPPAYWGGGV